MLFVSRIHRPIRLCNNLNERPDKNVVSAEYNVFFRTQHDYFIFI